MFALFVASDINYLLQILNQKKQQLEVVSTIYEIHECLLSTLL